MPGITDIGPSGLGLMTSGRWDRGGEGVEHGSGMRLADLECGLV